VAQKIIPVVIYYLILLQCPLGEGIEEGTLLLDQSVMASLLLPKYIWEPAFPK
jgi:hypothetical protein